jgi:prophage antirepressor-like protein
MNDIQVFSTPQFGAVRTAGTADNPMFCLADVCNAIGITNARNVKNRLDEDDVHLVDTIDNLGRTQQVTFVTESGLYDVIIRSDSEQARPFRKWVTSEILPSIRKTGSYSIQSLSRKELALMVVKAEEEKERLALENKKQAEKIKEDAPKVEHHDIFMGAEHGDVNVSVRKFIAQAGINGEKKFWHWLEYERKNIIYRDSKGKPMPYSGKYRHFFAMPDEHNTKNDWSGTQLKITPIGKVELTKMYYKDHPECFFENSKIKQLNLFQ